MHKRYNTEMYERLERLKKDGNYRHFLETEKSARSFPIFSFKDSDGNSRQAVNFCGNDYLCMSMDEGVAKTISDITAQRGMGSGGTRNISGTTDLHNALENRLATLHAKESALVFNSAFMANSASLATLGKLFNDCIFVSDEENHASIIEGIKNSGKEKTIFRHNDTAHLAEILENIPVSRPKIIVFESVYSISGDVAPAAEICRLAKKHEALTYCDEVHAIGLYGQNGSGMLNRLGAQHEVNIINGTLAKSYGLLGGYIAADKTTVDYLRSFAPGFIFTTTLPPALCAAAVTAINKVAGDEPGRVLYHQKVQALRQALTQNGILFHANNSHITQIHVGDSEKCKKLAHQLLYDHGIYLQPIFPPTVRSGNACFRITLSSRHTLEQIDILAQKLKQILA